MSRYQKYQTNQYLPSFKKQSKYSSNLRQQSGYSSYSQQPSRVKPKTQESQYDSYSRYRDYSPQPAFGGRREQDAYNYGQNHDYRNNQSSNNGLSSSKYDLTSSSVSALTTIGHSKKKSYSDVSNVENLTKSHAKPYQNRNQDKYDRSPIKEEKEFLKQKYKSYINQSKAGRGKYDQSDYISRGSKSRVEQYKSKDVELIPHKSDYRDYLKQKDDYSKSIKQNDYKSGDFKKDKSKYSNDYNPDYSNSYKKIYQQKSNIDYAKKGKYEDLSPSYKSQIKQKSYSQNYGSYKSDLKSNYETSYLKGDTYNKQKSSSYYKTDIKQDYSTNQTYTKPKQYIDKAAEYSSVLSEKERIKEAKKKYMEEMKTKLYQVNSLISKSKQLHLENEKTLASFDYLTKPKVVYQKIKFIADIRDFQIGKQKGEGKFGTVHQALHKATHTLYAIKKIPKQTIKTYMLQNQLALEIKLQSFVDHPNILKIFGFFDDWQYVYIVLEYMEQGTLFEYLRKKNNNKLPQKDVSNKIKEITEAIKYLHDMDIAHRDIKPENIVLSHGVAKLCDFGWATRCKDRRQTYCGTFDYAAPEILEGKQYNQCVDLWCLGILTYELLFGKSPFYHLSKQQTKRKVLRVDREQIQFPKDIEVSWKAKDFIQSLLKKNPSERRRVQSLLSHPFLTDSI